MAYQAKRSKKVTEELELVDENGSISACLRVDLSAPGLVEKIRRKYTDLAKVREEVAEIHAGTHSAEEVMRASTLLGTAVVDLLEAVFGREDAKKIIDFYEERYHEMALEILPFVYDVVLPRIHEIYKESKKAALSKYDRKQRRSFAKAGW